MTSTPPPSDSPEQFIGSYRITRKLGAGGMGEVFLAHDDRLRRDVAIKRIRAGASMGPDQRERLRREARAAAGLSHPSIVQVYDIIEEPDGDSIVMEYVEGRTLWDMITDGDLDGHAAIDVLLQVSDGLEAAHQSGLVHRDLKGENVIVGADGDAKILDFGVAKSNDPSDEDQALTTAGMAIGTYRSMSPEQCEGGTVDARSDLFSLGVMMYEMFGGRTPFSGKTPLHTLANVVGFDPPEVGELNGSIPKELSDLIGSLLQKTADQRPASASVVADTLEGIRDASLQGGIVMPRLTATPDSGIDPIGSVSRGATSATRRRRPGKGTTVQAPKRSSTARRILGGLAMAAVIVASFVVFQSVTAADDDSLNRVMGFPLVPGSGAVASIGEDVAIMIGTALGGAEPLQWIDGWALLEGDARNDIRSLTLEQAAALARSRGCGYFMDGRVVVGADSATVVLTLRDAESGEEIAVREASSAAEFPWRAGLTAVNGLLPELIPTAVPNVEASFTARPPAAVAQFLLGERAFRRADVDVALAHYTSAFEADPTFALAGIRGAETATWQHDQDAANDMLAAVLDLPLQPRTEAFARGILAFVQLDAERAVEHLNSALAVDPAMVVAWAALGEVYRHRAPRAPWPGGPRPFERAMQLDPLAGYLFFHRLEEMIRDGELDEARALRQQFRRGDPDQHLLHQIDVMYACVEDGPDSEDWFGEVAVGSQNVAIAAQQLMVAGHELPCGEALFRALLIADTDEHEAESRYWRSWLGLTGSRLARGELDDARRLIVAASGGFEVFQSLIDRSTVNAEGIVFPIEDAPWTPREVPLRQDHEESLTRWSELAVAVALIYPEDLADVGDLGAAALLEAAGADYSGLPYRTSLFLLGAWEARNGRPEGARLASDQLRSSATDLDETDPFRPYTLRLVDLLEVHTLLAGGDDSAARERLRELPTNAPEGTIMGELLGAFALERLLLAGLEERLGDPERALNLVLGFDEPSSATYIAYLPPGLATCVRTANQLRQAARARLCEERLTALGWSVEDLP